MTWHMFSITVDLAGLGCIAIVLALLTAHPTQRVFIPGFLLMAVGFAGALLRELIIPSNYWVEARIVSVTIGIVGFVLIIRKWRPTG